MDWPKKLSGIHLFACLMNVYVFIEESGSNGGGHRNTYANFLKEASEILENTDLIRVAELFEDAGAAWTDLALSGLPDSWDLLKEFRVLTKQKNEILKKQPPAALQKMQEIKTKTDILMKESAMELKTANENQLTSLLKKIQENIKNVQEKDVKAFENLKKITS